MYHSGSWIDTEIKGLEVYLEPSQICTIVIFYENG